MIAFLRGKFSECTPTSMQIDVAGVGYGLSISLHTYEQIKAQSNGKIYAYLHISDNAQVLYGFATQEEKDMFLRLITISGVGPAMALAALSTYSAAELRELIQTEQTARIQQIKGVGKKTAQRIVLELSDKLGAIKATATEMTSKQLSVQEAAVQALIVLGLSRAEAERNTTHVLRNKGNDLTLEQLVKAALHVPK